MRVACFCGTQFESPEPIAQCPTCAEVAATPSVSARDAEAMAAEVREIIVEQ